MTNPNQKLAAAGLDPAGVDALHICVLCASKLVQPSDWEAEGPRHWRVWLRCPDCEAVREGIFTQAAVDSLSDRLDDGSAMLIGELDRLTRENMAAEIEVIIRALEYDLVLPCDF